MPIPMTGHALMTTALSTCTSPAPTKPHPQRQPPRHREFEAPVTRTMTILSSQGCTAVSIDTCTALARLLVISGGVPVHGLEYPRDLKNPVLLETLTYLWARIQVFWGMGTGSPGKPQGYPRQSYGPGPVSLWPMPGAVVLVYPERQRRGTH
jgi:hypothetical protein